MREAFRFSTWLFATLIGTGLLAALLIGIPRLVSDDPCLRESGVDCTTAGSVLQGVDIAGVLAGLVAFRVLPILLVIAIAAEASQYRSGRRRRRPRRKPAAEPSPRRVGEQPLLERRRRR